MSITDELREWWVLEFPIMDKKLHKDFTAIADRIDAEHESACAEAYGNGVMSVPIALDESAWVKLPVDADGKPIHIGDTVTCGRSVWEVTGLRLIGAAWGVCCTIFNDHGGSGTNVYPPCDLRHYHAPTVEDVLCDLLNEYRENECTLEEARLSEYAAKLRLAEGEDA